MSKVLKISRDQGSVIALQAVAHLATESDLLDVFLGSTGIDPSTMRTQLDDLELQAAVLDFLLMDDAWVIAFSEDSGFSPEQILAARAALPGGDLPHWT